MKLVSIILVTLLIISPIANAAVISDVSVSDGSYQSIKNSVDKGYMSLFRNKSFQGGRPVTRKELALVIDKLSKKLESQKIQLSKSDLQELIHLSKNFKSYLIKHDAQNSLLEQTITNLQNEQKTMNYDLSTINDQLRTEIVEIKQQNANNLYYIGGGILFASFLALLK